MKETIQLYKSNNRPGATLLQEQYDILSNCILSSLRRENGMIHLSDLIEIVKNEITIINASILPWCFLQVKADLEAKHLIKIYKDYKLQQIITINPLIRTKRKSKK